MLSRFNGLAVVALFAFAGCDLFGGGGSGIGGRGDRDRDDDDRDEDEDCDPECDADEVCKDGECVARADTGEGEGEGGGIACTDGSECAGPDDDCVNGRCVADTGGSGGDCEDVEDVTCLVNGEICDFGECVTLELVTCPGFSGTTYEAGAPVLYDPQFLLDPDFDEFCEAGEVGATIDAVVLFGGFSNIETFKFIQGFTGVLIQDDDSSDGLLFTVACVQAEAGDVAGIRIDFDTGTSNHICGVLQ